MKVQIVDVQYYATEASVRVKTVNDGYITCRLPTHETLTVDSLKDAIKGALALSQLMRERMQVAIDLQYQDLELD